MEDILKKIQAGRLIGMINRMLSKNDLNMQDLKKELEKTANQVEEPVILPKPNPTCENCKYYQEVSNGLGYCKFNPPFTKKEQRQKYYNGEYSDLTEDVLHTEWTKVSDYDWCGQFEQRET